MKKVIFFLLISVKCYSQTSIPSSGAITMTQIATVMNNLGEISYAATLVPYSLSYLNSKSHLADKTAPFSISDWYGYSNPDTIPIQPCGGAIEYSGGVAFPTIIEITLGSSTGTVRFDFNSFNIPDKFIVMFDGSEVINSGYRGDTSYQTSLNAALAARGLPPETITSPGFGTVFYGKTTATTKAYVYVYAPLSSTSWQFTLGCPVP